MTGLKELHDITRTQVLAKGIDLRDLLNKDFLQEIKDKLGENYADIAVEAIKIMLLPKQQERQEIKEKENGQNDIIINLPLVDFIRFEQPSPQHVKEKVIVITSNRTGNLDKFLK